MAKPLVSDELWQCVQALLPPRPSRRFRYPGRKRLDDRKALTGILFVLKSGIPWEDLPAEMGCGSGMTCWRRLHEWNEAGVWFQMHQVLLARLDDANLINWMRAAIDSTFARAKGGVEGSGKNPTDRGRPGVKQHVVVDANGVPLAGRCHGGQRSGHQRVAALGGELRASRRRRPADAASAETVRGSSLRFGAAP